MGETGAGEDDEEEDDDEEEEVERGDVGMGVPIEERFDDEALLLLLLLLVKGVTAAVTLSATSLAYGNHRSAAVTAGVTALPCCNTPGSGSNAAVNTEIAATTSAC